MRWQVGPRDADRDYPARVRRGRRLVLLLAWLTDDPARARRGMHGRLAGWDRRMVLFLGSPRARRRSGCLLSKGPPWGAQFPDMGPGRAGSPARRSWRSPFRPTARGEAPKHRSRGVTSARRMGKSCPSSRDGRCRGMMANCPSPAPSCPRPAGPRRPFARTGPEKGRDPLARLQASPGSGGGRSSAPRGPPSAIPKGSSRPRRSRSGRRSRWRPTCSTAPPSP